MPGSTVYISSIHDSTVYMTDFIFFQSVFEKKVARIDAQRSFSELN